MISTHTSAIEIDEEGLVNGQEDKRAIAINNKNNENQIHRREMLMQSATSGTRPSFGMVMYRAMARNPWKITMLIRLSYIPMGIKNYGCAYQPIDPTPACSGAKFYYDGESLRRY